jgi:hypothetical protein
LKVRKTHVAALHWQPVLDTRILLFTDLHPPLT